MTLRARDIADLCDDLAIERASVTVMGGWDPDATHFALTFGPPAYRQTMLIQPNWGIEDVKAKLEATTAPFPVNVDTIATIAQPKPTQKRKKANARP